MVKSTLFALPLVTGLAIATPVFAKPHRTKARVEMTAATKESLVDKAFVKIAKILGVKSEENKAALDKIKRDIAGVVVGKETTIEAQEKCDGDVCLAPRKLIDPETGAVIEEEQETGRADIYSFSLGDQRRAQKVAETLRSVLKPLKGVLISVEGDTVIVENTEEIKQVVDFDETG